MSDVPLSQAARLREALDALPWIERRVFVLHAIDEHDFATIAAQFDIATDEVERLLASALVRLGRDLGASGR